MRYVLVTGVLGEVEGIHDSCDRECKHQYPLLVPVKYTIPLIKTEPDVRSNLGIFSPLLTLPPQSFHPDATQL